MRVTVQIPPREKGSVRAGRMQRTDVRKERERPRECLRSHGKRVSADAPSTGRTGTMQKKVSE